MFIILFYIIQNINIIKNIINIKNKYYLFFMIFIWCISVYLSIFYFYMHFQYCVGDSCILALTVTVTRCFINNK